MIPQLLELVDRYEVDGFWIDGDIWYAAPCYCDRCRAAFKEQTGISEPPKNAGEPHWAEWWNFTHDSFEQYVTRYCDAVHQHRPGVLVCSNWLQTFQSPGEPKVPTDFISGDNTSLWGVDNSRCQSRFISTRGKPWNIMLWVHYAKSGVPLESLDWTMKPAQMMQQEAALILALGGSIQTCEHPFNGIRDGRIVPWRMKRTGELAAFVKSRWALCEGTETIPQIVVLHSERHAYSSPAGGIFSIDAAPVEGAVFSLLECHRGVDILDEWAILPRLSQFPVVVVSEQERMSNEMLTALKKYVQDGGKLLVCGTGVFDRFGRDFLGVQGEKIETHTYYVPANNCTVPVDTGWRLIETTTAQCLAKLGQNLFPDQQLSPYPAATLNRVGRGAVAYIPCNIFRIFAAERNQPIRAFIQTVLHALTGDMDSDVAAPTCVDVVFRRKGSKRIVHLVNRSSGIPNLPNSGVIDEIPRVGPITVTMTMPRRPKNVSLAFEDAAIQWDYRSGQNSRQVKIEVPSIHIHAAVVVEDDA
jgi:hypothetical protein